MYIEILITIQTFFLGIFLYIYIQEKSIHERIIKDISLLIVNRFINYIDHRLDLDTLHLFKKYFYDKSNFPTGSV